MPKFSKVSAERLATCHPDLQVIMNKAIKIVDFSVVCGHRGEAEQNEAVESGHSKLKWPNSRHNASPSEAVDIIPWPTGYENTAEFYFLAGVIEALAKEFGIPLQWGGRWKSFVDLPHWEIKR